MLYDQVVFHLVSQLVEHFVDAFSLDYPWNHLQTFQQPAFFQQWFSKLWVLV